MLELSSRNNLFIQQNNIKLLTSWDCSKWLILHHRSTISSVKHQKVFYKILHNHSNFKNLISSQQDYEKLKTTILSLYEKKKAKISRQAHDNFANNRKTLYIFTQNVCHRGENWSQSGYSYPSSYTSITLIHISDNNIKKRFVTSTAMLHN